jgi:hypothetical protein
LRDYEYLSEEIRHMKKHLGIKNGEPVHDESANLLIEKKLKSWLDNSPINLVSRWFDTVDCVKIHPNSPQKDGLPRSRRGTECFSRKWESRYLHNL